MRDSIYINIIKSTPVNNIFALYNDEKLKQESVIKYNFLLVIFTILVNF
jgi:hypothetical protein